MSYARMEERATELEAEVARWMAAASVRIGARQLVPRLLSCELPFDARTRRVALPLPRIDFGDEDVTLADAAIQTLTAQHTDFDFHHVKPACVFRCVMKLQALKKAVRLRSRESFVQGPDCVSRKIVHHHADSLRARIVNIDQIAHANSEIPRCPLIRHFHMAPGFGARICVRRETRTDWPCHCEDIRNHNAQADLARLGSARVIHQSTA
jgi:hypothetical protein